MEDVKHVCKSSVFATSEFPLPFHARMNSRGEGKKSGFSLLGNPGFYEITGFVEYRVWFQKKPDFADIPTVRRSQLRGQALNTRVQW